MDRDELYAGAASLFEDSDVRECLMRVADKVAANCSATNGQVLDGMVALLSAYLHVCGRNDVVMPQVADAMVSIALENGRGES